MSLPTKAPDVLEFHPLCLCIPEMSPEEYDELRTDIECVGLKVPIMLYEGMILDGRHRYRACMETGIEPTFEQFVGPGSAYEYVISHNLKRRNLKPEQRLAAVSAMADVMRDRARDRQSKAGKEHGRGQIALGTSTQSYRTPADRLRAVAEMSDLMRERAEERARPVIREPTNVVPLHTREEIAKAAGVSGKTASDFMTIKERGTEADVKAVVEGKASIKGKAKEVRQREAVERAKPKQAEFITLDQWREMIPADRVTALETPSTTGLNRQENESIGWAAWSWNPVTGCKHNCPYCYARDIAARFYPQGFEPSLIPSRLRAPLNEKPRKSDDPSERNIFTCSMADLFGRWVPDQWIDAVMGTVKEAEAWNFLFLTKFPKRMIDREVPPNVWLGSSVDLQARVAAVEEAFERVPAHTRWLSIEPLIEPLKFSKPELFQWVVIGGASASSQTPKWEPPFEWVARLYLTFKEAGAAVYIKDNIGFTGSTRPREFPWTDPQLRSAADVFHYLKNKSDQ